MDKPALTLPVPGRRALIFVVEDNALIQEFLAVALGGIAHYALYQVASGSEALTVVGTLRPNLLLLDYHLPDMTGLQVYDHIHAKKEFCHLPAILISAKLPHGELEKRQIFGLQKPFHLAKLLEMIQYAFKISSLPEEGYRLF